MDDRLAPDVTGEEVPPVDERMGEHGQQFGWLTNKTTGYVIPLPFGLDYVQAAEATRRRNRSYRPIPMPQFTLVERTCSPWAVAVPPPEPERKPRGKGQDDAEDGDE